MANPPPILALPELRNILQDKQGVVCLHPMSEVETRKPGFHEVLLRLLNARGDEIQPRQFIPTAVQHTMMPWLDMLTLDLLETQVRVLKETPPTPISINISRHSLLHQPYMDRLQSEAWKDLLPHLMFELKTGDITRDVTVLKNLIGLKAGGTTLCVDYQQGGTKAVEFATNLEFEFLKMSFGFWILRI